MHFSSFTRLLLASPLLLSLCASSAYGHGGDSRPHSTPVASQGLRFEENKGQYPEPVQYMAEVNGGRLWLERTGLTYGFCDLTEINLEENHKKPFSERKSWPIHCEAFKVQFVGANADATVDEIGRSKEYHNYFHGNDASRWASDCRMYDEVIYRNLYPGIHLRYYQKAGVLKYDFIVEPGADPRMIRMQYDGVQEMGIDKQGNLRVRTVMNDLLDQAPVAWLGNQEQDVECAFVLNGKTVSFQFPKGYDASRTLVIDPTVIFSTYVPSTNTYGYSSTYDDAGNLFGGGISFGAGFPTTAGAYDVTFGGSIDMGIIKLNPGGTAAVWCTYIGGSGGDHPMSMITDPAGDLYIYGSTDGADFPTTAGAYDVSFNGGDDITVTRINAAGTTLVGSTFVGGTGIDGNNNIYVNYGDGYRGEIMLDAAGDVYVASNSSSSNFPTTAGCYDGTYNGMQNGVAFKINPTMTSLIWSTYLGGSNDDSGYGIKIATSGTVYVCGGTRSAGFPTTAGAYDVTFGGGLDGFISALDAAGASLLNSTFVGTTGDDQAFLMDLDDADDVYIYGQTTGAWPIIGAGVYSVPGAPMFINRFDPTLGTAIFSTTFGVAGAGSDISPIAFLVDNCSSIYISGFGSTTGYPVTGDAYMPTTDGSDFYLAVFLPGCTGLSYATFFGDPFDWDHVDGGTSRFDKDLTIYHAVCAGGTDFPIVPTPGAYGPVPGGGGWNLAVFKIEFTGLGMLAAFATFEPDSCVPHPVDFTNLVSGTGIDSAVWDFGDGSPLLSDTSSVVSHTYLTAGTFTVKLIVWDSSACNIVDSVVKDLTVFPNPKPDAGPDSVYCSGDIVPLGGPPVVGWTYSWSPAAGLNDSTLANPLCSWTSTGSPVSQTYIVTVVDDDGCSGKDTVTVTFAIPPTPGTLVADTMCQGEPVPVAYAGPLLPPSAVYNWTFTGAPTVAGTGATVTCTWATPGWHYITLSVTTGFCVTPLAFDSVYIYPSPVVSITPVADQCVEGNVFNFSHTGTYLPGTTFLWTFGPDATPSSSTLPNPTGITFAGPGPKTVTLVATDAGCPSAPVSITFDVNPMPDPNFSFTGICLDEPFVFTDLTPGTNIAWAWNFADAGATSSLQNPSHTFSTPGAFPVHLTVTNTHGCVSDTTITVIVHPLPDVDFSHVHKCFNTITEFTDLTTLVDPFGSTVSSWAWDFGDPASGVDNTSSMPNPTHSYPGPGFYTVTLTVTSTVGCTMTLVRDIEVPPTYPLIAVNDSVCTGYSATLSAYGDWPGTTITWYEGMGGTTPIHTGNTYVTPPLSTTTTYYVSLTEDAGGCESQLTPVLAWVYSIPSVDITLSSAEVNVPNAIVEFTTTPFGMTNVASYYWQFGDGHTSTAANPVHQWQMPGEYPVTLDIVDVHGCTHDFKTIVKVSEAIHVWVPNIFTPNGDGINDNFTVSTVLIVDLHTEIYDRWGKLVYETDNLSFEWPGKDPLGQDCPEGGYTYVMRGYAYNGQFVERSGIVLLTR